MDMQVSNMKYFDMNSNQAIVKVFKPTLPEMVPYIYMGKDFAFIIFKICFSNYNRIGVLFAYKNMDGT